MVSRRAVHVVIAAIAMVSLAATSQGDIKTLVKCQKQIGKAGARYANIVIKRTLRCTNEIVECQISCENGVYGPPCSSNPPPCCDPDDRLSNAAFAACMVDADERCLREEAKITDAEIIKRSKITRSCEVLTEEELCGAETPGLNFVALNAGCEVIIPGYTCNLTNLLDCVGGPLEQDLSEQIGGLLDPRSSEALAAAALAPTRFAGIERTVKVSGTLAAGKIDVWSIDGTADDKIAVRIKTRDDDGTGTSQLDPVLTYIGTDGVTTVGDTSVVPVPCSVPNSCGTSCSAFKRRFPFSGTFFLAVKASTLNGCGGGDYQLLLTGAGGQTPVLVADDVTAINPP